MNGLEVDEVREGREDVELDGDPGDAGLCEWLVGVRWVVLRAGWAGWAVRAGGRGVVSPEERIRERAMKVGGSRCHSAGWLSQ